MPNSHMSERLIRLVLTEHNALVVPSDDSQPFAVPRFPSSQLIWLDHLSTVFFEKHRRCLCVALMLDQSGRGWGRPEVPTQRCGADGAHWTWQADDFSGRGPTMLVGGSYQAAVLRDINEAISLVPPSDGVHLIGVKAPRPGIHAFIHADGQTVAVDARKLVVDDVSMALAGNADRLTLE